MEKVIWLGLSALVLITACLKENPTTLAGDELIGCWDTPTYTDTLLTFSRVATLKMDNYGIEFIKDGHFTERKIMGWCGTPPVHYYNYSGSWKLKGDKILIEVAFWGGVAEYDWKIISLDENQFTVHNVNEL